jgi:hypothetical protein
MLTAGVAGATVVRGHERVCDVTVGGLPEQAAPARLRARWLIGLTCAGWLLEATMRYWWRLLWRTLGVFSVPLDVLVWIVAIVLTVLAVPALLHRFRHAWMVVFVVGAVLVGGTAVVLTPWHDVLAKAWLRTSDSRDLGATTGPVVVEPTV